MIIKSPEKHLTDREFYTYSRFFDWVIEAKEIEDEKENFGISDLTFGREEVFRVYDRIFMSSQVLELPISINREYKFEEELNSAKIEIEAKPKNEKNKLLKIIDKIEKNSEIKITDVADISWVWYGIYDHIRFEVSKYKLHEEMKLLFTSLMNEYLDNFINNKLLIAKQNYYSFETQKQTLISIIELDKKISLYGNNFIITQKVDRRCTNLKFKDFCLLQTVYALQKLEYLDIINVWESTTQVETSSWNIEPDRYINVNIILNDSFIEEINNKYKKQNPKNIIEGFDVERGILKFAGYEIELSRKGNATDAVLLFQTLFKTENNDWLHNDQILKDWGYDDEDQKNTPKNKVYFAAQKINTIIATKAQIEDLIECNTSKARINPKYRKIDI